MTPATPTTRSIPLRSVALAAILAVLVLLPLLGHKPLTDWDEGIYAEVSREMLTSGWLVPHWNQQLWFEKPPLMLWITAASYRAFGISEFTARFGSALAGVALVTLLHFWLQRTRSAAAAWLSTLMLLACFGFLHICRVGETDTLLSLGCAVGLIGLTEAKANNPRGWLLFWSGAAVALMTKGAASVTVFLAAALFIAAEFKAESESSRCPLLSRSFWLGAALFLALTVPWHIAMILRFGRPFVAEYLGFHVLSRATHQIEGHSTHWWYYLKVLLVSAPPFALLYPFAALRSLRTGILRAFAIFAVVEFLFFTAVQTRLPHYIAPAYPAFIVVTADLLAAHLTQYSGHSRSFCIKLAAATAAVCAISIFATARLRASLHTAVLPNGTVLPDNKDVIAVLRSAQPRFQSIPGPLLVLRDGAAPINVDIFYSRHPVQQVQVGPDASSTQRDRYINNPIPLALALTSAPSLLLIDKHLEPTLPADMHFVPIQQGREVDLGLIQRIPVHP